MEEIRIPLEGLDRDNYSLNRTEGAYTFLLNGVSSDIEGNRGSIQNEMGNLKCYETNGFRVNGHRYMPEYDKTILFLTNGTTSKIGLLKSQGIKEFDSEVTNYCPTCDNQRTSNSGVPIAECSYEDLVVADCLNFSIDYPISVEYKITNCTLNIYFVDGHNIDRFLYFDIKDGKFTLQNKFKVGYKKDCDGEIFSNQLNCEFSEWYQKYDPPSITTSIENGGRLKEGVYQVSFGWSTSKGIQLSSYTALTQPIPIFLNQIRVDTDLVTNKGLRIKVDLDDSVLHEFYNLIIIQTINQVTTYKLITLPKSQREYFYTSDEGLINSDLNAVFKKYPYYKSSEFVTKANEYLLKGGLKEYEAFNIQRIANKVKTAWQTIELNLGDYADEEYDQNFKSYLRDEIISLGLVLILDNGDETPVGHIPGREASSFDRDLVEDTTNTDPFSADKRVERWRLFNTGSVTNSPHNTNESNQRQKYSPEIWEEGEFSYWESTEVYPNNKEIWGDLCGKPIRHHKFPDNSITHHHSGKDLSLYPNSFGTGYNIPKIKIYPIGIAIKSNISQLLDEAVTEGIINQEQRNRIIGWKLVRGNRYGNKTIISKGYLSNVREYTKNNNTHYYSNYGYNDLSYDALIYANKDKSLPAQITNKPLYSFHGADTHFLNPSITSGNILKIETEEYGLSEGATVKCEGEAEHKIFDQRYYNFSIIIASIIARSYEPNPSNDAGSASTIGQGVGSVLGGALGSAIAPGVGTGIGSALGGLLGGLIGTAADGLGGPVHKINMIARSIVWLAETEKIMTLIELAAKSWQYHWQYQSTGQYFAYKNKENDANKVFRINNASYVQPELTTIPTTQGGILFNNWRRESTLILESDRRLPINTVEDVSRNTPFLFGQFTDDKLQYQIAQYYCSIKNDLRNPYGNIFSIEYISTESKTYKLTETPRTIFGGDTFIGSMAIKIKLPFFIASTFGMGNGIDIFYEDLGNVGYPRYFFNTKNLDLDSTNLLGALPNLTNFSTLLAAFGLSAPNYELADVVQTTTKTKELSDLIMSLDGNAGNGIVRYLLGDIGSFFQAELLNPNRFFKAPKYQFFGLKDYQYNILETQPIKGKILLYHISIPTYILESDINLDFRYAENNKEKDFYPHQSNLDFWLQEKNVPFVNDNYYLYNLTYSKQAKEHSFAKNDINFRPYEKCQTEYPNRVINSQQDTEIENSLLRDNWLVNNPLDYWDFSYSLGKLKGINQLENDKVFVRFDNGSRMFPAYSTLTTDPNTSIQDTIQIGSGSLFRAKPISFNQTDLGYFGSQHRAFLSTEFGHVSVDSRQGCIFLIGANGQDTKELSAIKMKSWFRENLPFRISKYFDINTDNNYNGLGLTLGYDNKLKRLLVTKLDYEPKMNIKYIQGKFYYQNKEVSLRDERYFRRITWTISYDFLLQTWRGYHSYTPDFYISGVNDFLSVRNTQGDFWVHNKSNKFYQNFYGVQYPFIIDGFTKPNITKTMLKSVSFSVEARQYTSKLDWRNTETTFEKAVVYNTEEISGLLNLKRINPQNLFERISLPRITENEIDIILDKSNDEYTFNQFNNKRINQLPIWINDNDLVDKKLNEDSIAYYKNALYCNNLKSQMHFVRLINESNTDNSIILKYIKLEHHGGIRK